MKKLFSKVLSVSVVLTIVAQLNLPIFSVLAAEVDTTPPEQTEQNTTEEEVSTDSTSNQEVTIESPVEAILNETNNIEENSVIVEPTSQPEITLTPTVTKNLNQEEIVTSESVITPTPVSTIVPTVEPVVDLYPGWNYSEGSKSAKTSDPVEVGKEYTAPFDSDFRIEFTSLPQNSDAIEMREYKISHSLAQEIGALDTTVYEVNSSMTDGTFEYKLSLPLSVSPVDPVTIKSAESLSDLKDKNINDEDNSVQKSDEVELTADHFTVFYISADTTSGLYTSIDPLTITETTKGTVIIGTIILNVPTGFEFDTASSATATVTANGACAESGGNKSIRLGAGTMTQTVVPTTNTITFNVQAKSKNTGGGNTCASTITFTGIKLRPTAGNPLSSGNVTRGGTATGGTFTTHTATETVGVMSATVSTVDPSPASIPNDGITTSTITVTLLDQFSNPVSGKTVTLSSDRGATDTISAASGASDVNGQVTFTVTSLTEGTSTFTGTNTTDGITITQTATVIFADTVDPDSTTTIANDYYGPNSITASTINGTASDNVGVTSVELAITRSTDGNYWDGGAWVPGSVTVTANGTDTWDYDGTGITFDDGVIYTVTPIAFDNHGNFATGTADSFTWDSSNPIDPNELSFGSTSPSLGAWSNNNTIDITFDNTSATDGTGSGVDGFYYEFNTDPTTVVGPKSKLIEETVDSFSSSLLGSGTYYVHLATVDNVGNWTSTVHFGPFLIDTTAPTVNTVEVLTDYAGAYVDGNSYRIRAYVEDEVGGSGLNTGTCMYTLDNGDTPWVGAPTMTYNISNGYCRIPVGSELTAANGTNLRINVQVTDNAGNTGYGVMITRTADTDTPKTNSITITPDTGVLTNGNPTLEANITDTSVIQSCQFRNKLHTAGSWGAWQNATWDQPTNTCTYSFAGLTNGSEYDFSARGLDSINRYGGGAMLTFTRTVDSMAPVVSVNALSTNDNTPALTGTVDDATATLTLNISGDPTTYTPVNNGDGTWTLADDTIAPALADGTYDVTLTAVDTVDNTSTDTSTDELYIDTMAPIVGVNSLVTNDPTPQLTGTVDDATATLTLNIDGDMGTTYNPVNNGDGTWTLADNTVSALVDGTHEILVTGTDLLGNVGSDTDLNEVLVDTVAPSNPITLTSTSHTIFTWSGNDTVDMTWSGASDAAPSSDIAGYSFMFSNNAVDTTDNTVDLAHTADPHTYTSANLGSGIWYFHLSTIDKAGNQSATQDFGPIWIDMTGPVLGAVTITPAKDFNPYVKASGTGFNIFASVSDGGSGIAACQYRLRDGDGWLPATYNAGGGVCRLNNIDSTLVSDAENININFKAIDNIGNETEGVAVARTVDINNPTAGPVSFSTEAVGYVPANFTITSAMTDSASPITACSYRTRVTGTAWGAVWTAGTWDAGTGNCTATLAGLPNAAVYDYQMRAQDSVNHVGNSGFKTRVVDAVAPTVNAGTDKTINSIATQDATATDAASGMGTYAWTQVGGPGTVTFGSANSEDTTISADVDGVYTLQLTVTDKVGNTSSDTVTLTWDTTDPTVDVGADVVTNTQITKDATTSDGGAGINDFEWTQTAGPGTISFGDANSEDTTIQADVDGVYTITLTVTDNAGNTASDSFDLTWDTTSPVIDAGLDVLSNTDVDQNWSATDALSGVGVINWTKISGPGNVTFTNPGTSPTTVSVDTDGTYTIQLEVFDLAGNSSTDTFVLTSDKTAPTVSNVEVLTDFNPYVNGNSFRIRASVSDGLSGLDTTSCEYTIDGSSWVAAEYNSGNGKCRIPPGSEISAPDGSSLTINMRVKDAAGNIGTGTEINRTADSAAPQTSGHAITPDSTGYTNGDPTISATITDSTSPISLCQFRYRLNNGVPGTWTTWTGATWDAGSSTCSYTMSGLNHGDFYDFAFRGKDSANHYGGGTTIINRKADTTAPVIDALSDINTNAIVTVNSSANDSDSGVANYVWTEVGETNALTFGTAESANTTIEANAEGTYTVRLTVTDNVGNSSFEEFQFTWDVTSPVVTVNPKSTTIISPELTGTVNDPFANIMILVAGVEYTAMNNENGTWTLPAGVINPTLFRGNTYEVVATATDGVGNSSSDETSNELRITRKSSYNNGTTETETPVEATPTPEPSPVPTAVPTPIVVVTNNLNGNTGNILNLVNSNREVNPNTETPQGETSSASTDVPNGDQNQGQVAGASTDVPQNGGNNLGWLVIACIPLAGIGLIFLLLGGRRKNEKK